ncbi:MAG: response regulator [Nitrospinae bacterium]|nr:response regulator [Nitrospinota bacterium]
MGKTKFIALLVDDSKLSRNLLKHYIFGEFDDVDVFEASNGNEALEIYRQKKPDLTFLDLTMPGMNGFEFLETLKASGDKTGIIAVLSADMQDSSKNSALTLGADYFVQKPIKNQLSRINGIVNNIRAGLGMDSEQLSDWQREYLEKLFEKASAKAAEAMATMTEKKVSMTPPHVSIVDRTKLSEYIREKFDPKDKLIVLKQPFSGNFNGYAFVIAEQGKMGQIAALVSNGLVEPNDVESYKDTLMELTNVLLGSCVGAFGNNIEMPVTLFPPMEVGEEISKVDDASSDSMLLRYALVAKTTLNVDGMGAEMELAMVLSISSMKVLMAYLDGKLKAE